MTQPPVEEFKGTFKGPLEPMSLQAVEYIIIHHAASDDPRLDVMTVHGWHQERGWAGIGYHFFIKQDGIIQAGRPLATRGAHTLGYNDRSWGVCFAGHFERRPPTLAQMQSLDLLLPYLKDLKPNLTVGGHGEFQATLCPGKFFPLEQVKKKYNAPPPPLPPRLVLNGQPTSVPVVLIEGRGYMEIRSFAEAVKARRLHWDEATRTIYLDL